MTFSTFTDIVRESYRFTWNRSWGRRLFALAILAATGLLGYAFSGPKLSDDTPMGSALPFVVLGAYYALSAQRSVGELTRFCHAIFAVLFVGLALWIALPPGIAVKVLTVMIVLAWAAMTPVFYRWVEGPR